MRTAFQRDTKLCSWSWFERETVWRIPVTFWDQKWSSNWVKYKDNLLKTLKEYSATEKILLLVILVLNWGWFLQQQSRIRYAGMLEEATSTVTLLLRRLRRIVKSPACIASNISMNLRTKYIDRSTSRKILHYSPEILEVLALYIPWGAKVDINALALAYCKKKKKSFLIYKFTFSTQGYCFNITNFMVTG